jgi:hypothetical protein
VRRRLLHGSTCGDALTGLFSATQSERRSRSEPIGQDGECLPAGRTDSASHPNAVVPVIVRVAEAPSMADYRAVLAKGASSREEIQRDHPGSMLSFASGSAIKRITAGVKARRDRSLLKFRSAGPGLHPPGKVSFERKKNTALRWRSPALRSESWPTQISLAPLLLVCRLTGLAGQARHRSGSQEARRCSQ